MLILKTVMPLLIFVEVLVAEQARARRHGRPLTVMALRVDFDGNLKDRERVMDFTETQLRERIRLSDYVAFYRDGTYLILMPETGAMAGPAAQARLLAALRSDTAQLANVEGAVQMRAALRLYDYTERTGELPDLKQIRADLEAIVNEVLGAAA